MQKLNEQKFEKKKRKNKAKSNIWFKTICLQWQNEEFQRHFRITRETFEWLLREILPEINENNGLFQLKLATTLWWLATGESFRAIAQRFGIGASTFHYYVRSIIQLIINKFLKEKIRYFFFNLN